MGMSKRIDQFIDALMEIRPKGLNIYITKHQPSPKVVELTIELSEDKLADGNSTRSS
jgi:hypothetical protein